MSDILNGIGNQVSRFWEHGLYFLGGCAAACALGFLFLLGGRQLGFQDASDTLATYGLFLLLGVILFASLAIARWREGRPRKALFLVAEEEQSFWGHSRQTSGEVLTTFSVRMHATNVSDTSFHISKPRILRPWRARWREHINCVLSTRHPSYPRENTVSQEFAILAHHRSHATAEIAIKGAVCKPGKRLTFVIGVLDHQGRRHHVKFKRVRATNDKPA